MTLAVSIRAGQEMAAASPILLLMALFLFFSRTDEKSLVDHPRGEVMLRQARPLTREHTLTSRLLYWRHIHTHTYTHEVIGLYVDIYFCRTDRPASVCKEINAVKRRSASFGLSGSQTNAPLLRLWLILLCGGPYRYNQWLVLAADDDIIKSSIWAHLGCRITVVFLARL